MIKIKLILKIIGIGTKCFVCSMISLVWLNISILILAQLANDAIMLNEWTQLSIFLGLMLYEFFSRNYVLGVLDD